MIVIDFSVEKNPPFAKEKILSVILDVEKYSEFIPWCDVKIASKKANSIKTKVSISYGIFKYSFDCRIEKSDSAISISGSKFLQFSFDAIWSVEQTTDAGSRVRFNISIKTPVAILKKRLQNIISRVSIETVELFVKRINFLYSNESR